MMAANGHAGVGARSEKGRFCTPFAVPQGVPPKNEERAALVACARQGEGAPCICSGCG